MCSGCVPNRFGTHPEHIPNQPAHHLLSRGQRTVIPSRSGGGTVLIQIARAVRLTLQDAELQALQPGEIYEVAPAIGRVLVTDGWAREVMAHSTLAWRTPDAANDDPAEPRPTS